MHSMTGFGRGCVNFDGREVVVEIKSVNHRFLDISFHSPRVLAFTEDVVKKILGEYFSRGHIDVFVSYKNTRSDAKTVSIDENMLMQYQRAFAQLKKHGIKGRASIDTVIGLPDILSVSVAAEDRDALLQITKEALCEACDQMKNMRITEGECLKADLSAKLDILQQCRARIKELSEGVAKELADKLKSRLQELLGEIPVDEQRLAQELVIQADRLAIDEEIVRLGAHIDNMRQYMQQDEPLGRKLEFVLQEINREVNTIGSKAMNVEVQSIVVTMKGELEKLREQVQNVQ